MTLKERIQEILRRLRALYPHRGPFVEWSTPLELVIGTVLSAQCTDVRVNIVTKELFKKYKTARDYADANLKTLENEIKSTGFYKVKAKYLKGIGTAIYHNFDGKVPGTLKDLITLPGVSYKSSHLIMAKAFGTPTGVAVDTHVSRLAPRLGLTRESEQRKIETDLEQIVDPKDFLDLNELFIMHGRAICKSKPLCTSCVLNDICPSAKKFLSARKSYAGILPSSPLR